MRKRALAGLLLGGALMSFDPGMGGGYYIPPPPDYGSAYLDPGYQTRQPYNPAPYSGPGGMFPLPPVVYSPNVYGAPQPVAPVTGFDPGMTDAPQAGPPQAGVTPGEPYIPPPTTQSTDTGTTEPIVEPTPEPTDPIPAPPPVEDPPIVQDPALPPVVVPPPPPPPPPPPMPRDITGYRPGPPMGTFPGAPFAPNANPQAFSGAPLPTRPGNIGGFRPSMPAWARGLFRSPYAQATAPRSQPLAAPSFGRFQTPYEEQDPFAQTGVQQMPAWAVTGG